MKQPKFHEITVHDIDEAVYRRICSDANLNGRTVEDEARLILLETLGYDVSAERASEKVVSR